MGQKYAMFAVFLGRKVKLLASHLFVFCLQGGFSLA